MNKKLHILFYLGIFSSIQVYAQNNVIYKCIDNNNNVTYHNVEQVKGLKCAITDLGKQISKSNPQKNNENKQISMENAINKTINIPSENTRNPILEKELDFENNQLKTVESMLEKANQSQEKNQIEKLQAIKKIHEKNIEALSKELGFKTKIELMLPKNLPIQQ